MPLHDRLLPWLTRRADDWPESTNGELSGRERQGIIANVASLAVMAKLETHTESRMRKVLADIAQEEETIVQAQLRLAELRTYWRELEMHVAGLPEIYSLYFNMDRAEAVVSLSRLVSTKTDEENVQGGKNAPKYMLEAALGRRDKRDPILVRPSADHFFEIIDGNGTFTAAQGLGWEGLPVQFESLMNDAY